MQIPKVLFICTPNIAVWFKYSFACELHIFHTYTSYITEQNIYELDEKIVQVFTWLKVFYRIISDLQIELSQIDRGVYIKAFQSNWAFSQIISTNKSHIKILTVIKFVSWFVEYYLNLYLDELLTPDQLIGFIPDSMLIYANVPVWMEILILMSQAKKKYSEYNLILSIWSLL